jgi:hypothetical protein
METAKHGSRRPQINVRQPPQSPFVAIWPLVAF